MYPSARLQCCLSQRHADYSVVAAAVTQGTEADGCDCARAVDGLGLTLAAVDGPDLHPCDDQNLAGAMSRSCRTGLSAAVCVKLRKYIVDLTGLSMEVGNLSWVGMGQ